MLFAIRDDDTSCLTNPSDLMEAYDFIEAGCVSLSVVPATVPTHKDLHPYGISFDYREYPISENPDLISHLKAGCKAGRYDILLHGYSHEYQCQNGVWTPELLWKSEERIFQELMTGKAALEALLDHPVRVLVAPNNGIDQRGISAAERLGLNFSGTLGIRKDRAFDLYYCKNYLNRWLYRAVHQIPYGGILQFKRHQELYAYSLDDFERLKNAYQHSKREGHPFVVYTHYWTLKENSPNKNLLRQIYQYVMEDGAELVPLSACFTQ